MSTKEFELCPPGRANSTKGQPDPLVSPSIAKGSASPKPFEAFRNVILRLGSVVRCRVRIGAVDQALDR
jgi:hypothetical protein